MYKNSISRQTMFIKVWEMKDMRHGKKFNAALSRLRERQALRAQIEKTLHKIDSVRNHIEQVVDPTLIDCYIYELNAAQLRYQFLLQRFKSLDMEA